MQNETIKIDSTGNPAALGLLGFGMTTVLLNVHNAGFVPISSMILAMGIFYGGIAQVIAGIMEWKKGNTFACTAFISYGFFWLTFVGLLVLPKIGWWDAIPESGNTLGVYLSMWGLFTLVMYVGTFRLNKALQFVFGSLTILFILLACAEFSGNEMIGKIAGYEGIICGLSAVYAGLAQVLNEVYGKVIWPLGVVTKD
ncbi:acetate uptake transporter [Arachidicoccus sp.]|uniref:acetate uptake transporter n=1 Tax=Arachidicoccus sp. TaxID=1872624 RepID=UPI003D24CD1E